MLGEIEKVDNNQSLTQEELESINLCLKIRQVASSNHLKLDQDHHRVPFNLHIIQFISAMGLEPLEFIQEYLMNLQPFMITRDRWQEKSKNIRCIIDFTYYMPFYIKLDLTQFQEIIISFHEDYNRRNFSIKDKVKSNYYILITDKKMERSAEEQVFTATIPRGFLFLNYKNYSYVLERNCVKIPKKDILQFFDHCIENMLTEFIELHKFQDIVKTVSFTSYGHHILNNISLMIDLIMGNSNNHKLIQATATALLELLGELDKLENSTNLRRVLFERFQTRKFNKISTNTSRQLQFIEGLIGGNSDELL